MKTPKEIFDNRYLYYRDALGRPKIPLEARQLIFNLMQEYANETIKNLKIPKVSDKSELLIAFYNYTQENDIDHNIPQRIEKMVDVYLKNKLSL